MKTEDLLKPRYKVIADYPNCPFKVGNIYDEDCFEPEVWKSNLLSRYPHIFRLLQWWEDRLPEDLPLYVKDNYSVYKTEWRTTADGTIIDLHLDGQDVYEWSRYLPATEQQYLDFLNAPKTLGDLDWSPVQEQIEGRNNRANILPASFFLCVEPEAKGYDKEVLGNRLVELKEEIGRAKRRAKKDRIPGEIEMLTFQRDVVIHHMNNPGKPFPINSL